MRLLSAFARDTQDFLQANPALIVVLVILAVVFFRMTQPNIR